MAPVVFSKTPVIVRQIAQENAVVMACAMTSTLGAMNIVVVARRTAVHAVETDAWKI